MNEKPFSESTEMYLKALAELNEDGAVGVNRIAERLNVTHVSANEMVQRLVRQGLVSHTPYKGARLTKRGRATASDVIRRQRLWECFLFRHLNIEWAHVYDYACSLEHATAPEVTDALAEFLGNPKVCPHGNPIPDESGIYESPAGIPLTEMKAGQVACVQAIKSTSLEIFKYLQEKNLLPGKGIKLIQIEPLDHLYILEAEGREMVVGESVAQFVIVEII